MPVFGSLFLEASVHVKFHSGSLWWATLTPRYFKVNVSMENGRSLFFFFFQNQALRSRPCSRNDEWHGHPFPWRSGCEVIEAALDFTLPG